MDLDPLSIIFVKSDSKGDRLLFRYPYHTKQKVETKRKSKKHNPYALNITEDLLQTPQPQTSNIVNGHLSGFTDEVLSTLFAVKPELCNQKFELKVNDVRFVGHPTLLPYRSNKDDSSSMILINIVFALRASASHSIVKCYYDLSKRLGIALRHEEKRCAYLSEEMKIMIAAHDEVASAETEDGCCGPDGSFYEERGGFLEGSLFHLVLARSKLAASLKEVYDQLCSTGLVHTRINDWVLVSFCVPHKAHQLHNLKLLIEPESVERCLSKLRPYHGMLLLVDPNELLASIPLVGSPALVRLVKLYSPLKSLQTLAIEADLMLSQVCQLVGHLVYWAKATIIYPLCESNVYVVAPGAEIYSGSPLVTEFAKEFPGLCLLQMLTEFSLPAPLWYHARCGRAAARLPRAIAWMLQHRLLLQLHTYVQIDVYSAGKEYFCEKHDFSKQPEAITSIDGVQVNIPAPIETRPCSRGHYLDADDTYPTKNNLNQTNFSHTKPLEIESDFIREYEENAQNSFENGFDTVDGFYKEQQITDMDDVFDLQTNDLDYEESDHYNDLEYVTNNIDIPFVKEPPCIEPSSSEMKQTHENENAKLDNVINDAIEENIGINIQMLGEHLEKKMNGDAVKLNDESDLGLTMNDLKLNSDCESLKESDSESGDIGEGVDETDAVVRKRKVVALKLQNGVKKEQKQAVACSTAGCAAARLPRHRALLTRLHHLGYLNGDRHIEEIMFMENLTRSQVVQLLDKFRDILITYETEDPAVAMLYPK